MSDFAVGFYNIVYEDILSGKCLLDGKYLTDCCFAGDTMNSFNAIANLVPEAGGTKAARTEESKWPEFLKKFYKQYHCLANFWVLPMCIGRSSAKLNRYDSTDMFLNLLKSDYEVLKRHVNYWEKLGDYDEFCERHFLNGYEPLEVEKVKKLYSEGQAQGLVAHAAACMEKRAETISSRQDICERLYRYFQGLGLVD